MPEIKDQLLSRHNIPATITSDAHQFVWRYDSAFTTWKEAQARCKEIIAEGGLAMYHRASRAHAVYKRKKGTRRAPR